MGTVPQRTPQTQVDAALLALVRGEPIDVPDGGAWVGRFVAACRYHRIAPLAHVALRESAPEVAGLLRADRDHALGVHIRATILLAELGRLLPDLPWATFKGPVLSEAAHPVPGLRGYHDVDVLVDPRDLREVSRRLLAAGWTVADYEDMLRNPRTPGEMHWVSPSGLLVDLHWSMINMAVRRERFAVHTERLLDRRVEVPLGLERAWTLDAADALVHVCLHAALTGANRLLYLLDVEGLSRRVTDWDEVSARARAWRAEPQVSLVLARAHRVLGTHVPADLDAALGMSRAFGWLTGAVDAISPVVRARDEHTLARLVARAAGPGAGRTLWAAGRAASRGVAERVAERLGGQGLRGPRPDGAGGSGTPHRATADGAALAVYLDAVELAAIRG